MPASIEVTLSFKEMLQVATVGAMRQVENIRDQRSPAFGAGSDNDWQLHIEGAAGEFAFAKALNLFWSGAHRFRAGDVGNVQVRTRSRHSYDLIVHREDSDSDAFVLVTGKNGRYRIRGWILGRDAKIEEFWKDPAGGRPAYFVPADSLLTLEQLPWRAVNNV